MQLASGAIAGCGYDSNVHYVQHPAIQMVSLPSYSSDPNALLTVHALQTLGLKPVLAGWLVQTPHALSNVPLASILVIVIGLPLAATGGPIE